MSYALFARKERKGTYLALHMSQLCHVLGINIALPSAVPSCTPEAIGCQAVSLCSTCPGSACVGQALPLVL